MISVSSVTTAANGLKVFTKKGYRLLSKETGIKLDSYQKAALKNILPENVCSVDIVKIESQFGKGHKKVMSFRDEKGGLIKRVLSEYENEKQISKTISEYERNDLKTFFETVRKKYAGGRNVAETREAFSVNKELSNYIGHTKLDIIKDAKGNRQESQVFEAFHKKGSENRKYIETTALRTSEGNLINKTIKGNTDDLQSLKEDPYLFVRNYSNEDFLKAIVPYAKKTQGVENRKIHISDKRLKSCGGFSQPLPFYNRVVVDSQQGSKSHLVNVLNHELRHQWQDQLLKDFNCINFFLKKEAKKIAPENAELARKLWKADVLYCPHEISHKAYWNNFKEIDARAAGEKAKRGFEESSRKLAKLFPCTDKRLYQLDDDFLSDIIADKLKSAKVVYLDPVKLNLKTV